MKAQNILETIGNTTHLRLSNLFPDHNVWIKLERENPGGSIKDRVALAMIEDAEKKGILRKGSTIIEPTSGNTGIGLALVAAVKKYRLIVVMPESMSEERRKIMAAYGAELVLTPKEQGMKGAIEKANQLIREIPESWLPMQFDNESNRHVHQKTTALEIFNDFPEGIDYLITGVGTGGHISGVSEILKSKFEKLKVMAIEPKDSPVISGGNPGLHQIQGIGAGFIPGVLDQSILDGVVQVGQDEAYRFTEKVAKEEGLFVGISTGASLAGIQKQLKNIPKGKTVLTFAYDTGERYLSTEGLFKFD